MVLKHISLYAKPGQKIAFVGSTGAGKTTITNLSQGQRQMLAMPTGCTPVHLSWIKGVILPLFLNKILTIQF